MFTTCFRTLGKNNSVSHSAELMMNLQLIKWLFTFPAYTKSQTLIERVVKCQDYQQMCLLGNSWNRATKSKVLTCNIHDQHRRFLLPWYKRKYFKWFLWIQRCHRISNLHETGSQLSKLKTMLETLPLL